MAMALPETSAEEDPTELLRQYITRAVAQQLECADWSLLQRLKNPVLRFEACLEEAPGRSGGSATPGAFVFVSEALHPCTPMSRFSSVLSRLCSIGST